jgi:hypothetical protein
MAVSGITLIFWTESHLQEASLKFDSTTGYHNDTLITDPLKAWQWESCHKGKVYPFVSIENYTSPNGDKLYCDCKYAIIPGIVNTDSAIGFVKRMKSLR